MTEKQVQERFEDANLALAIESSRTLMNALSEQVKVLEKVVLQQAKLDPRFDYILSINGIGQILALTIMLETGNIEHFKKVGNFASYSRCVGSEKLSNGKRKGKGSTKNGNKYLARAFIEAANYAIRFNAQAKRFYQRKMAKRSRIVAIKAVAHKLARASYYIMRDHVPFDSDKLFS